MSSGHDFLNHMAQYHAPATARPAVQYSSGVATPVMAGVMGGFGGSSRNISVIASDSGALNTLRRHDLEDRADSRASAAAFLGGLATLILSGGLAYVLKTMLNTRKELQKAREFKQEELPSMDSAARNELRPILNKHIEILEAKAFHHRNIVILTGAALACAAGAFLGGMFAVQSIVTAAIIAGVATGAFAVFTAVWYAMDESTAMPEQMQRKLVELSCQTR